MFKFLEIKNFQSHKNTHIDFDPRVNVIYGLSQAGKTATVRALRLLIYNRPLGGKFFSDFAGDQGETKIILGLENKEVISLSKSIKLNKDGDKQVTKTSYKIGEIEYSSPKDQIPDQVAAVLNISELNIQMQADPPFLVASSGGEIAKTINRITRLEEVDDWVAELTSEINSGNRDVVRNEEDAKRLLQDISVFKDIDETEAIINELKVVSGLISKLSNERYDLDRMLIQYENSVREYEKLDKYFLAEKYVLKAEKIQSEIDDFYFLKNLIEEYDSLTESIKAKEILNQVEGLIKEIEAYYKMKDLLYVYENNDKEYQKTYDELEEAKLKYIEIISKIGKCPVCFAPMSSKHLKEIERSL